MQPNAPADAPERPAGPTLLRQISKQHSHKSSIDLFRKINSEREGGDDLVGAAEKAAPAEEPEAEPPAAKDTAKTKPEPPRLVRGKTGLVKKRDHAHEAIAELVVQALPSWADLDTDEIEVKDVSGHGGSKTFKVTAPDGTDPPAVAMHSRSESVTTEEISEPRLAAAAAALLGADVAPRRLAQGGDWYIVAWAGKALGSPFGSCEAEADELGRVMANIHKVPTDWYEPFRAKIKELMPAFSRVSDGSHVWWYSARMQEWLEGVSGDTMAFYAATMPEPTSAFGKKIVTCHGDFHAGNLVRDEVCAHPMRPFFEPPSCLPSR